MLASASGVAFCVGQMVPVTPDADRFADFLLTADAAGVATLPQLTEAGLIKTRCQACRLLLASQRHVPRAIGMFYSSPDSCALMTSPMRPPVPVPIPQMSLSTL